MAEAEFIEVVSVCDIIPERAEKAAEQHKIPNVYPNIDAMLGGPKFDLLVNTTSMPSHYPVNKKALEAGATSGARSRWRWRSRSPRIARPREEEGRADLGGADLRH